MNKQYKPTPKRRDPFRKRHYIYTLKQVVKYCTYGFGYKNPPFLFESINEKGALMFICRGNKNRYAIFYDYLQFKRIFGHLDFDSQEAYAAFLIAHEMRHYYQMRQLDSKTPCESKETLELWRSDDENPKFPGQDCSVFEFYMQPMEIDAELFAYHFVAEEFDSLVNLNFIGEGYLQELEKYHVKLFGDTDDILFHFADDREGAKKQLEMSPTPPQNNN